MGGSSHCILTSFYSSVRYLLLDELACSDKILHGGLDRWIDALRMRDAMIGFSDSITTTSSLMAWLLSPLLQASSLNLC
jgi:hypothetical protein